MCKIILVDDEDKAMNSVSKYIKSLNKYEILGLFKNGKEAKEFLEQNLVDIVITDVRMPIMDGIELTKYISENNSNCKTIIVSGYADFEYVQKALKYNAYSYILKPIDFFELSAELEKISNEIIFENKRNEHIDAMQELFREQLFIDISIGVLVDAEEIKRRLLLAGIHINPNICKCAIINIEIVADSDYYAKKQLYHKVGIENVIMNTVRWLFGKNVFKIISAKHSFKILTIDCEVNDENINNIKNNIKKISDIDVSVSILHTGNNLFDFHYSVSTLECATLLVSYLHEVDIKKSKLLIEKYLTSMPLVKRFREVEELFKILNGRINLSDSYKLMESLKKADMQTQVDMMASAIFENNNSSKVTNTDIIEKAKLYISENYQNDISRDDVADSVFIASAYFSRLFKQNTGETFQNYLIKFRLDKSAEFLKKNRTVSEVSILCGFGSSRYFSKNFKSYFGCTPSEYQKRYLVPKSDI